MRRVNDGSLRHIQMLNCASNTQRSSASTRLSPPASSPIWVPSHLQHVHSLNMLLVTNAQIIDWNEQHRVQRLGNQS